ncbi:MAG: hypothetical protein ACOC80_15120 [Petrotogales bacterium]
MERRMSPPPHNGSVLFPVLVRKLKENGSDKYTSQHSHKYEEGEIVKLVIDGKSVQILRVINCLSHWEYCIRTLQKYKIKYFLEIELEKSKHRTLANHLF